MTFDLTMRSGPYCITDSRTYSSCGTTLSWPTPFADANYSVTCTGIGATDSRANITIAARLAHGVVVNVVTYGPVAVSFSEVDCAAVHDALSAGGRSVAPRSSGSPPQPSVTAKLPASP